MAEFTDAINIDAPPHVVFDFLTTEAGLTSWMGTPAMSREVPMPALP